MSIRALQILPLLSILLAAQPAQDPTVLARKALDLVLAGQYAEFLQMSTAVTEPAGKRHAGAGPEGSAASRGWKTRG